MAARYCSTNNHPPSNEAHPLPGSDLPGHGFVLNQQGEHHGRKKRRSGGGIEYTFIPNRRETMRALAMANFTGQEFRVIIALMNQTNGYLRDEDDISSTFWQSLTLMPRQSVFKALQRLVGRGVIAKNDNSYRLKPPNEWPRSVFSQPKVCRRALRIATDLIAREKEAENYRWLSDLLKASPTGDAFKGNRHLEGTIQPPTEAKNEKKRHSQATVRHPAATVRHPQGTNRSPTGDDLAMPKERDSSKDSSKEEGAKPSSLSPATKYLFEKTGRKRWPNLIQKEKFAQCEQEVGSARMIEAIDWALTSGISNIKSMITAAREGKRYGFRERRRHPGENRKHAAYRGFEVIESKPEGDEVGGPPV